MTVAKAARKLAKHGEVRRTGTQYWARIGTCVVSFLPNGEDKPEATALNFHCRDVNDRHDMSTDYHAGSYFDTITAAIAAAHRWTERKATA